MSYQIVYERQFIKTSEGKIIPLILSGSNNCYTPTYKGRDRRERSWFAILQKTNRIISFEPQQILNEASAYTGGTYQEHFKFRGKWVNDAAFLRFFEKGIKQAKTIEELSELNQFKIDLKCYLSIYYDGGKTYSDGTKQQSQKNELLCYVKSSEELDTFLKLEEERIDNRSSDEEIYVYTNFTEDKAVPYPKVIKKKPQKERLASFYAIKVTKSQNVPYPYYISKLSSRAIFSSRTDNYAKQFKTEKEAQKWLVSKNIHSRFKIETEVEYIAS